MLYLSHLVCLCVWEHFMCVFTRHLSPLLRRWHVWMAVCVGACAWKVTFLFFILPWTRRKTQTSCVYASDGTPTTRSFTRTMELPMTLPRILTPLVYLWEGAGLTFFSWPSLAFSAMTQMGLKWPAKCLSTNPDTTTVFVRYSRRDLTLWIRRGPVNPLTWPNC